MKIFDWLTIINFIALIGIYQQDSYVISLINNINKAKADKNLSYKLNIRFGPKWGNILLNLFPKTFKNIEDINTFFNDTELNRYIEGNRDCLLGKDFYFTCFVDGVSGQEIIWSNYYKSFVDEISIKGELFNLKEMENFRIKNKILQLIKENREVKIDEKLFH